MNRRIATTLTCAALTLLLFIAACARNPTKSATDAAESGKADGRGDHWIGTWATAPQPFMPGALEHFQYQSLRLIVHVSAGGKQVRVKISNTYGDQPLVIAGAHIARRSAAAEIDPSTDRRLTFHGQAATTVAAKGLDVSDPVDLEVPALSDLAISIFLPQPTDATTSHLLALQTSYVSTAGDFTGSAKFPVAKTIDSWPFLTGVDVAASDRGVAVVALGSSLTDGDGSSLDGNRRWPDVLAERLQKGGGNVAVGVLNEGIIGNRLLTDSPQQKGSPFGAALGQAGLARFERDVLEQAGVRYVIVGLGINDIGMPGALTPASEQVSAESLIAGYRKLIARGHEKGIRVIGSTNPPFENSFLRDPPAKFYTPEKEAVRQKVNDWIRDGGEFDGVIDFDALVRDPGHVTQLLPKYDSGDHLHPNDAGYEASANAISLALFGAR